MINCNEEGAKIDTRVYGNDDENSCSIQSTPVIAIKHLFFSGTQVLIGLY